MGTTRNHFVAAAAIALVASPALAAVQSMGQMDASQPMTGTIVFKLRDASALATFIDQTGTPGPAYHKFLTPAEFRARYAPTDSQFNQATSYLKSQGLKVAKTYANHMAIQVSGSTGDFERVFGTPVMNYQQSGEPMSRASFHRPAHTPVMPDALAKAGGLAVVGLSNQYRSQALHRARAQIAGGDDFAVSAGSANVVATDTPGEYTVGDVAKLYNVNPLYARGLDGSGVTLGIATYADFLASDATTYWNMIGLNTKPDRIVKVPIDGGSEYGADAGTGETSLDVEQSGGLAPFANIVVYDAPNTDQGGIDMFNRVVSDNTVDTLSYSWGLPEIFYYPQLNDGVDFRPELQALNQLFMEAAAQGISLFVASGDAGGYDSNSITPYPDYSKVVSVDAPGNSPYVTAAGGTTVPITLVGTCSDGSKVPIKVTQERAWAYDYLASFYQRCRGLNTTDAHLFSGGAGGGVSTYFAKPAYQNGISGIAKTPSNQALIDYTADPVEVLLKLPANFAGRNIPDISMNADPDSGYLLYSTADGGLLDGYGGTSFVAPQLNGIIALINQDGGARLGLINRQLYALLKNRGYGTASPFRDIVDGDNWYWQARSGFEPATGIGTPDAARLSAALTGQ